VRDVQSGPPLGPSRSKGSEAGCQLSSSSSRRSKCPPPRFVRGGRAAGRRRSVPNGDSRCVSVAKSSRSTRARRGSVDVSVVIFSGTFSVTNGGRSRQRCQIGGRVVACSVTHPAGSQFPRSAGSPGWLGHAPHGVSSNRARPGRRPDSQPQPSSRRSDRQQDSHRLVPLRPKW
jgi:hypothetical protein